MHKTSSTPLFKLWNPTVDELIRRWVDVAAALLGLLILSPLFIVVAIWVKIDSKGPVFYRARRVGRGGTPFQLYKFRSMVTGADKHGPGITTLGDSRVTPVGRFLRRTKIDELPQLINVLIGDMSLVGPRPEDPRYVAVYTPAQRQLLNYRPGMTSAASFAYRDEARLLAGPDWETVYRNEVMPRKLALDLAYFQQRTLLSDLLLIWQTVIAMFLTKSEPSMFPNRPFTGVRMRYLMSLDLGCILLAIVMSFVIRYEALVNVWPYLAENWIIFALAVIIRLPVYYVSRLYYRLWRYASTQELYVILLAGGVSSALIYSFNFGLFPLLGLPYCPSRSIWALEGFLSIAFLGGTRLFLRLLQERLNTRDVVHLRKAFEKPNKVLIVGAGDSGAVILREIQSNPGRGLKVVGLIDDDPAKQHMHIHNVPILGNRYAIPGLVAHHEVEQIIIAMPTAPGKELREIVTICEQVGIHPRTIPGIYELLDGKVKLSQLRDIEIEDLLRREPIFTDTASVHELLQGKRILVTGGGGSIGSELCRQILRCQPAELTLVGHGENSIFEIHNELLREQSKNSPKVPNFDDPSQPETLRTKLQAIIADVRFPERVLSVFEEVRPEIVFHAAAHKHVPLMELNPAEAITNNVIGTRNLLQAAQATNVAHFVMISTDKAVNPTSVMGASKRAAELLVHEAAEKSGKPYVAVRFGNVLGSRGSVIHTFKEQIKTGGPITVTDPEMKRYFMTIPEAVQLVLQAAVLGSGGEVFLLDMGEPVKIVDLARDMVELSGLEVGSDIDIVFSGLRPGEKLFEELFIAGEEYKRTRHEKIFIAGNASKFVPAHLNEVVDALDVAAQRGDKAAIIRGLQNLIPEYQSLQLRKLNNSGEEEVSKGFPRILPSLKAATN